MHPPGAGSRSISAGDRRRAALISEGDFREKGVGVAVPAGVGSYLHEESRRKTPHQERVPVRGSCTAGRSEDRRTTYQPRQGIGFQGLHLASGMDSHVPCLRGHKSHACKAKWGHKCYACTDTRQRLLVGL